MDTFSRRRLVKAKKIRGMPGHLEARNGLLEGTGISLHPTKGWRRDKVRSPEGNRDAIKAHFKRPGH